MVVGRSSSRRMLADRKSPLSPNVATVAAANVATTATTTTAAASAIGSSSTGGRNVVKRSGSTQFPDSPTLLGLLMRSRDSFTTTNSNGSNAVVVAPWDDDTRMLALKV